MPPEANASVSHALPQPAWVLLTASNNRLNMPRDPEDVYPTLRETFLLSSRGLNASNPAELVQPLPEHPGSTTSPVRTSQPASRIVHRYRGAIPPEGSADEWDETVAQTQPGAAWEQSDWPINLQQVLASGLGEPQPRCQRAIPAATERGSTLRL